MPRPPMPPTNDETRLGGFFVGGRGAAVRRAARGLAYSSAVRFLPFLTGGALIV